MSDDLLKDITGIPTEALVGGDRTNEKPQRSCTCSCGCGEPGERWDHQHDMLLCNKCFDFYGKPHKRQSRFEHEPSDE